VTERGMKEWGRRLLQRRERRIIASRSTKPEPLAEGFVKRKRISDRKHSTGKGKGHRKRGLQEGGDKARSGRKRRRKDLSGKVN